MKLDFNHFLKLLVNFVDIIKIGLKEIRKKEEI